MFRINNLSALRFFYAAFQNASQWLSSGDKLQGIFQIKVGVDDTIGDTVEAIEELAVPALQNIEKRFLATKEAFLGQPSKELIELQSLSGEIVKTPEEITIQDAETLNNALTNLVQNDYKLLKRLLPDLSQQEIQVCVVLSNTFQAIKDTEDLLETEEELLKPLCENEGKKQLVAFNELCNKIVKKNTGYYHKIPADYREILEDKKTYVAAASAVAFYVTGIWTLATPAAYVGWSTAKEAGSKAFERRSKAFTEIILGQHLVKGSETKIQELNKAIEDKNMALVQKSAKELEPILKQLIAEKKTIFTATPLKRKDEQYLTSFAKNLPLLQGNAPPPLANLAQPVEKARGIIDQYYPSHAGLLEQGFNLGREKVNAKVDEIKTQVGGKVDKVNEVLGNVPQAIFNKGKEILFGYAPPPPPQANPLPRPVVSPLPPSLAPQTASAPINAPIAAEEGTIAHYLAKGINLIQGTLSSIGLGGATSQAMGCVSEVVVSCLNQFTAALGTSPSHAGAKQQLEAIIANLRATGSNGAQVVALMQQACGIINASGINAYISQFCILGSNSSGNEEIKPEAAYAENMKALEETSKLPSSEPENPNWEILAKDQKDHLIFKTTHFLAMKHVYENVCGLQPPTENMYLRLLNGAMETKKNSEGNIKKVLSEEKLEEAFFEEISKTKKVSYFKMLGAKLVYWLCGSVLKGFISKSTTIYFQEIFKYIGGQGKENFQFLKTMLIDNFTAYLTILGGAYRNVADKPNRTDRIDKMLMEELEQKQANFGVETQELYEDFIRIVLKKTTGHDLIISMLTGKGPSLLYWLSPFFRWIGNKIIGNPVDRVRAVVDQAAGSLRNAQGYTHALNVVIGQQLDMIWKLLEENQQAETTEEAIDPQSPHYFSEGQKSKLKGLVKNLFEILPKSKCVTVDELHTLTHGKSLKNNLNQLADEVFIQDVIEQTTTILAATIESLIKEDQLHKLVYQFATLANNVFEIGQEVTQQQMQDAEQKIAQRSEQILHFAVNSAVKSKFDFSRKMQQEEANRQIEKIRQDSEKYFKSSQDSLRELAALENIFTPEATNKIDKLLEETQTYLRKGLDAVTKAKNSGLHSNDKIEIGKIHQEIEKQSQVLIQSIRALKNRCQNLESLDTSTEQLTSAIASFRKMEALLYQNANPSVEKIVEVEKEIEKIEKNAQTLNVLWQDANNQAVNTLFFPKEITASSQEIEKTGDLLKELQKDIARKQTRNRESNLLQLISEIQSNLLFNVSNPSIKDLDEADRKINKAEELLGTLKQLETHARNHQSQWECPAIQIILSRKEKIATLITGLRKKGLATRIKIQAKNLTATAQQMRHKMAIDSLNALCTQANSPLEAIVQAKKINLQAMFSLSQNLPQEELNKINQHLQKIEDQTIKSRLLASLQKIVSAPTVQATDDAKREFLRLTGEVTRASTADAGREKYFFYENFAKIEKAIVDSKELNPNNETGETQGIRTAIQNAQTELAKLRPWIDSRIKKLTFVDFTPKAIVDFQNWLAKGASQFVYGRVREKVDGFLDLIKREETLKHGVVNHMIIGPYVRRKKNE